MGRVNLVKEVKWRRITPLDGEHERQGNQGLLTPRQLLHFASFLSASEGYLDADTGELFHQGQRSLLKKTIVKSGLT